MDTTELLAGDETDSLPDYIMETAANAQWAAGDNSLLAKICAHNRILAQKWCDIAPLAQNVERELSYRQMLAAGTLWLFEMCISASGGGDL